MFHVKNCVVCALAIDYFRGACSYTAVECGRCMVTYIPLSDTVSAKSQFYCACSLYTSFYLPFVSILSVEFENVVNKTGQGSKFQEYKVGV
jgi:hypothetical protein